MGDPIKENKPSDKAGDSPAETGVPQNAEEIQRKINEDREAQQKVDEQNADAEREAEAKRIAKENKKSDDIVKEEYKRKLIFSRPTSIKGESNLSLNFNGKTIKLKLKNGEFELQEKHYGKLAARDSFIDLLSKNGFEENTAMGTEKKKPEKNLEVRTSRG